MSLRERQQREGYFDASTQGASSCFRVFCCAYGDDGFRRERFALTQKGPVNGRDLFASSAVSIHVFPALLLSFDLLALCEEVVE